MNICLHCGRRRQVRRYLCLVCWYELPATTRLRLSSASDPETARNRLFQLLSALHRRIPLEAIEVAS